MSIDLPTAFSAEGLASLRAHPALVKAGDAVAEANVQALGELDDEMRWMMADLGRVSLCGMLAIQDVFPAGATAAGLMAGAASSKVCSRGRVVAFLQYGQAKGRIHIPNGPEPWTQRRLQVSGLFHAPIKRMMELRLRAMSLIAPELLEAADRFESPGFYQGFLASLGLMMSTAPDIFQGPRTPITVFMERHGGMDILRDLTRGQPPDRGRLLENSPLSRSGLARRNNVSRTQVMRLLADAEAQGLLSATRDRIIFSAALSDDAERHLAFTVQTSILALAAVSAAVA